LEKEKKFTIGLNLFITNEKVYKGIEFILHGIYFYCLGIAQLGVYGN